MLWDFDDEHSTAKSAMDCINEERWQGVRLLDVASPKKKSFEAIVHTWRALFAAKTMLKMGEWFGAGSRLSGYKGEIKKQV